jgi:hypothetical protein
MVARLMILPRPFGAMSVPKALAQWNSVVKVGVEIPQSTESGRLFLA